MRSSFDVLVIGSGPGGEGATMQAAKAGKSVIVVERYDRVGGGCTHWNTIPSKALRHAIQEITNYRRNPLFGKAMSESPPAFPDLVHSAASVIDRQADMRQGFYDRNGVEVLEGHARFVDQHTVEVERPEGPPERISAKHFVIAVGSGPYHPPQDAADHGRPLLRLPGRGDPAHRPGGNGRERQRKHPGDIHQHHVQLPDDGGSLPGRRPERPEPPVLSRVPV